MFLNYLAGVVCLVLTISAFLPWITIWFYSLKGIESIYGIGTLLLGLVGLTVSAFQHLSGRIRGRVFIGAAAVSLVFEGLYIKKMSQMGQVLNEVLGYFKDIFGERIMMKFQEVIGEQWAKVLFRVVERMGVNPQLNSFDFLGGGLMLAVLTSLILLAVGLVLEKNKTTVEA